MAFGPRIVGKDKYQAQKARTQGRAGFGPRVIGRKAVAASDAPAQPYSPETQKMPPATGMSVELFASTLRENPALLEALYLQELQRPEGPRRACLLLAREVAVRQKATDIVTEIDEVLPETEVVGSETAERRAGLAAEIARIDALDNLEALRAEADKLGITQRFPSKKATREAIRAHLQR